MLRSLGTYRGEVFLRTCCARSGSVRTTADSARRRILNRAPYLSAHGPKYLKFASSTNASACPVETQTGGQAGIDQLSQDIVPVDLT